MSEQNNIGNNKRLAKNTVLLYGRMLFLMLLSLYTARITLATLGIEDYGIYNVVGGVIATMSFLLTTLSSSTQRFITFELGGGNTDNLIGIFSCCLAVHWILAIIVVFVGETLGVWFLNTQMNIPETRLFAANIVLQCSIGSFVLNVLSVPYNGLIIAYEKMSIYAYISIFEGICKLLIVYLIQIFPFDALILYAILWLAVGGMTRFFYSAYCMRNYKESRVRAHLDKKYFRQVLSFSGYNTLEIFANMLADQGLNIMLNIFFGPAINAARGIAIHVKGALGGVTGSFTTSLTPQITKNYAAGNYNRMNALVLKGNKFSFYLFLLVSTPVFFAANVILCIWLKNPPEYAADFIRCVIILGLFQLLGTTFYPAVAATGNIKQYQLICGVIRILILPAAYFILNIFPNYPLIVYLVPIIWEVIGVPIRVILMKRVLEFDAIAYYKTVFVPVFGVMAFVYVLSYYFLFVLSDKLFSILLYCVIVVLITSLVIYIVGLSKIERIYINNKIYLYFCKLAHR